MENGYIMNAINSKEKMKIITVNGFQMAGKIHSELSDSIVVLCGNNVKLVYKHAISTIERFEKA